MVDRFVLFSSRNSVGGGPYVVEQAYDLTLPRMAAPGINNAHEHGRWPQN